MKKPKKIIIFDFDATLVNTINEEMGRALWLEKTGTEYPHIGWWSKPESLSTEIFDHPINKPIYEKWKKWIHHRDSLVYLVTGRMEKVKKEVLNIVDLHSLSFDEIYCNKGGKDTYTFKSKLFEKMIEDNPQLNEFIMYDDREEHIFKFKSWMNDFDVKITLHDVVNNTVHTNF